MHIRKKLQYMQRREPHAKTHAARHGMAARHTPNAEEKVALRVIERPREALLHLAGWRDESMDQSKDGWMDGMNGE